MAQATDTTLALLPCRHCWQCRLCNLRLHRWKHRWACELASVHVRVTSQIRHLTDVFGGLWVGGGRDGVVDIWCLCLSVWCFVPVWMLMGVVCGCGCECADVCEQCGILLQMWMSPRASDQTYVLGMSDFENPCTGATCRMRCNPVWLGHRQPADESWLDSFPTLSQVGHVCPRWTIISRVLEQSWVIRIRFSFQLSASVVSCGVLVHGQALYRMETCFSHCRC